LPAEWLGSPHDAMLVSVMRAASPALPLRSPNRYAIQRELG
jgi:hypothetical protein